MVSSRLLTARRSRLAGGPSSQSSRAGYPRDAGSATLEFIALTLVLLVPLVYLVLAVGRIQAGTFAADAAARDAARGAAVEGVAQIEEGASTGEALAAARQRADAVVTVALDDFGVNGEGDAVTMELGCSTPVCFAPGTDVFARVEVAVTLPGVPSFLHRAIPLNVNVTANAASPIDGLADYSGPSQP